MSLPRARHARFLEDAVDAGSRELDLLALSQHFGQMLVVEANVLRFRKVNHLGDHRGIERIDGTPASIAMWEGRRPVRFVAPAQPPDLPDRDSEQAGRLRIHERARQQMVQNE